MTIDSSVSVGLYVSTSFSISAGLIIPSTCAGFLLPVILDITKLFYIGKPIISASNITAVKTLKGIIWIAGVSFPSLDIA